MTLVNAVLLGLLQGFTEFLPVSSSGHLVLAQHFLGYDEPMVFFDVMLHVGTLAAVCAYYRRELLAMAGLRVPGALSRPAMVLFLALGTVPTVAIALVGREFFTQAFGAVTLVCGALIVTGFICWSTRFSALRAGNTQLGWRDALLVGAAQGLAITPGISRSGTTIAAGLWLGLDRELAARYSFLLAVPAILGATILEWQSPGAMPAGQVAAIAAGTLTAALSGFVALWWLVRLVTHGGFWKFAPYCWLLGVVGLLLTTMPTRPDRTLEVRAVSAPPAALVAAVPGEHAR